MTDGGGPVVTRLELEDGWELCLDYGPGQGRTSVAVRGAGGAKTGIKELLNAAISAHGVELREE